jgi:hypothetical protein
MRRVALALSILALPIFSGCRSITGDEIRRERQPARIRFYHDPIVIEIPSTVSRGTDFEVRVRTYGGGCIDEGDTEVTMAESHAELRPFDIFVTHLPPNVACPDVLRVYVHRATLRFAQAGTATVRVRGRSVPGDEVIVVERQLTVE